MSLDFNKNYKAFLTGLSAKKMTGQQQFLAVATYLCKGKISVELKTRDITDDWKKTVLGGKYNSSYYHRAQKEGWVNPKGKGIFVVTQAGIDQLLAAAEQEGIVSSGELRKSGSLIIVNRKGTHTFDKLLRGILAGVKRQVLIADSYVDDSIFDNLLDLVSKNVSIKMLYGASYKAFDARSRRFRREYPKYEVKKYKKFHDRFMVCDGTGYVLGPSLKDAASDYSASIVILKLKEAQLLEKFFKELWKEA